VAKSKKFARNIFIIGQAYLTIDGCPLDHSCKREWILPQHTACSHKYCHLST